MEDITKKYEFQQILQEAAHYRLLRRVFDSLPVDKRDGYERAALSKDVGIAFSGE
jgi:hypothetical protein